MRSATRGGIRRTYGAEFKLDVGLYRLDQQVACQRYRQPNLDATSKVSGLSTALVDSLKATFGARELAPAVA